jgi:hypothetical protein
MVAVYSVSSGPTSTNSVPEYSANYLLQKPRISEDFGLGMESRHRRRSHEQSANARALAQLSRGFGAQRNNLAFGRASSGFSARGPGAAYGLNQFAESRNAAFGSFADQVSQGNANYQADLAALALGRDRSLQNLDLSETERRAALAADLRSLY